MNSWISRDEKGKDINLTVIIMFIPGFSVPAYPRIFSLHFTLEAGRISMDNRKSWDEHKIQGLSLLLNYLCLSKDNPYAQILTMLLQSKKKEGFNTMISLGIFVVSAYPRINPSIKQGRGRIYIPWIILRYPSFCSQGLPVN